jgi:sulfide:quinone oxidoreductase
MDEAGRKAGPPGADGRDADALLRRLLQRMERLERSVDEVRDTASKIPSATGAAVRKQAPVVSANLLQRMRQGSLTAPKRYGGYSSCPLVTAHGKPELAEFDFDNRPLPSFPFDTSQERYSMHALKVYVLPDPYRHGMLKGRA